MDAEAVLDGLHAEGDTQVRLADAGRSLDEEGLFGAQPGAGGEGVDAGAFDAGLEGEVEGAQGEAGGEAAEAEAGADAAFVAVGEFGVEQVIEEGVRWRFGLDGVGDKFGEAVGLDERPRPGRPPTRTSPTTHARTEDPTRLDHQEWRRPKVLPTLTARGAGRL